MKLMIASDIHGSKYYCQSLMKRLEDESPDKLLLLGDILYHGPRNDLPRDYSPKDVISMLNGVSEKILCVRGNCDSEVDQMVLNFPIMASYAVLFADGLTIYASHGHEIGENNPPPLSGDACRQILLCGHTHVPKAARHESFTYINPGSVSIPKEKSPHSYMTYENGLFVWKDIDANAYNSFRPLTQ